MIRRPPRSPRTDTLCPYTTLVRSVLRDLYAGIRPGHGGFLEPTGVPGQFFGAALEAVVGVPVHVREQLFDTALEAVIGVRARTRVPVRAQFLRAPLEAPVSRCRSTERRVGKACVHTSRSLW